MPDTAYQTLIEEDQQARAQALDVAQSFLVQAPAGSGKTELLIQRLLALLARVDRPERVLAMTFTRKAAAEMRERVITALRAAHAEAPLPSPHARQTRDLALAVLAQDAKQQWHLLEQPSRLRVTTIDAFCAQLLQQTPLTSRWGAMPAFEEFVQPRYEAAVREALREADEQALPFWREVLKTLNNDGSRVVATMSALLAKREQWLPLLAVARQKEQRQVLHKVLAAEVESELRHIRAALQSMWPAVEREALRTAMNYAAAYLAAGESTAALASTLTACAQRQEIWPASEPAALADWRRLADWLLIKGGSWRKTLDKRQGFPSPGEGGNAARKKEAVALLAGQNGDSTVLSRVRILPAGSYHDDEWRFIDALLYLLPRVLARFQLMCVRDGVIDFAEAQLTTIAALGEEEAPSDLLLALDMRIEHLLIDEFQDTSQTQMTLLRKLTVGWQPGDGRTLFAVGDPMQSIYRFRQAEVGLFLAAQATQRINDVPVTLLTLTRNFRSQARLVEWTNAIFPAVFAPAQDAWRGMVMFKVSAPTQAATAEEVAVRLLSDPAAEGAFVAQQAAAALERGARDVAILVRARTHLNDILPALREQGIAFTAVRLDRLGDRRAVTDLLMLTHTLIQPDDELAWLSLLRTPWCGLTLADLTALTRARVREEASGDDGAAAEKPRRRGWRELLLALPPHVEGLSDEGSRRLTHLLQCWRTAYATSHDRLSQRLYRCWLALRGPSCLDERGDLLAAASFFECLDAEETAGGIPDWPLFVRRLGEAFLPEDVIDAEEADARVKVMTLHQAKGLQFDTVIMPGLGRASGRSDTPLLRWRQRPQGLLLAAQRSKAAKVTKAAATHSGLDDYLTFLENEEERHELARLLYVGVTRAERQLILTAVAGIKEDAKASDSLRQWCPPKGNSALALWWPGLCAQGIVAPPMTVVRAATTNAATTNAATTNAATVNAATLDDDDASLPLRRLPDACFNDGETPAAAARPRSPALVLSFDETAIAARHVGTVVHDWLSRVGTPEGQRLQDWTPAFLAAQRETIAHHLLELGVPLTQREAATQRVIAALNAVRDDPFGQWLLDPAREAARNEWPLSFAQESAHADDGHMRLDRTFVDDGTRWIVDYKIAEADSADTETWLDAEVERYRPQLEGYAALMKRFEERPQKLILYYPLLRCWREVN